MGWLNDRELWYKAKIPSFTEKYNYLKHLKHDKELSVRYGGSKSTDNDEMAASQGQYAEQRKCPTEGAYLVTQRRKQKSDKIFRKSRFSASFSSLNRQRQTEPPSIPRPAPPLALQRRKAAVVVGPKHVIY